MPADVRLRALRGAPPLPFDAGLDVFRAPDRQEAAIARLARDPAAFVWVVEQGDATIGYLSVQPPDPVERWGALRRAPGGDAVYEIGAIEVAPRARGAGHGSALLDTAFGGGRFDDALVLAVLYAWHYDLARRGLGALQVRRALQRFYARVGFEARTTRDPDITEDPANALLVRVGSRAPAGLVAAFEALRTQPAGGP